MARSIRLFVALYPPIEIAQAWAGLASEFLPAECRCSDAAQVHMTLLFIGDTPERELPEVRESVERSVKGIRSFEVGTQELVLLPERGTPRLLAIGTTAPSGLMELRRRLVQRFAHPKSKAERSFLPHLTLARFPGLTISRATPAVPPAVFQVESIRLVRSELRPTGAEHSIDKIFALQPKA